MSRKERGSTPSYIPSKKDLVIRCEAVRWFRLMGFSDKLTHKVFHQGTPSIEEIYYCVKEQGMRIEDVETKYT